VSAPDSVTLVYAGQRQALDRGGYLVDTFVDPETLDEDSDTSLRFKVGRKRFWWLVIGNKYTLPVTEDGSYNLGVAAVDNLGPSVSDTEWHEMSAKDTAARDAKKEESALKKLSDDSRRSWSEALLPIKRAMRGSSAAGRAAIKLAVLAELERG
tara:strand:+ start:1713 stop:2174 length:462 start_codon:yes stop_codon:yes gene_type:complete